MATASPRATARIAGVFYLLNITTGALALFVGGSWGLLATGVNVQRWNEQAAAYSLQR